MKTKLQTVNVDINENWLTNKIIAIYSKLNSDVSSKILLLR